MAISNSWNLVAILVGVATILYLLAKRKYSYWDRKGFKSIPGVSFLFGNFSSAFLQQKSFIQTLDTLYRATNERFVGIYTIFRPILLLRDPELIQTILTTDFKHFTDRGIHCNEDYDSLSVHLLGLRGSRWKNLRVKLSPTFTSGKLKGMFSTLIDCGTVLQEYLANLCDKGELLEIREISAANSTNTIASTAFGIDIDAVNNPNEPFRVYGRKIFGTHLANSIRRVMYFITPGAMSFFRVKMVESDVENFFTTVVKENLDYREKNNIVRKDFFQLLIQLKNSGTVQLDDKWEATKTDGGVHLSFNEIVAQTFLFFAAGFETSSSTLTFCMYELAKNPEIQAKVHKEIDRVLEENDGKITYETVLEMKFLESCIDETLRKYSIAAMLTRTCVKDYVIPGTDKVIEKGTEVIVPIYSLGHDSAYYDEPNTFNPDRFSKEGLIGVNQVNRPYYPFGDGPRNCIGMRLGKMQTKVGLVSMLQKFSFELDEELKTRDLKFDPKAFVLAPLGDLKLRVHKRLIEC